MVKEIPFLNIDGNYGGDQNWLPEHKMKRGGCSTVVAVEMSSCLKFMDKKYETLSPLDEHTSKERFIDFSVEMFKYVWPKYRGLPSLDYFEECYNDYAKTVNFKPKYEKLDEAESYEAAEAFVKKNIDEGYPIGYLLLEHESRLVFDITWHWFTVTGYEETGDGIDVIFGTWGERCRLPLRHLWNKGNPEKPVMEDEEGGLIVIK